MNDTKVISIKEKLYSIHELAKFYSLSPHTLRYYEKIGLIRGVDRDVSGRRKYTEWHRSWIRYLLCFKSTGMPLKDLRDYLILLDQGDKNISERKEILVKHRERVIKRMKEIKTSLELIEQKIAYYSEIEDDLKKIKKSFK
jgi:DNA-binding transcriptional MerR regulator